MIRILATAWTLALGSALAAPAATAAGTDPAPPGEAATETRDSTAEEASWTWFGMGFENRREQLDRDMARDRFGPDVRPSGGFGAVERPAGGPRR